MNGIIRLDRRSGCSVDTLICSRPWEFRKARWRSAHFVQVPRALSRSLEREGRGSVLPDPPGLPLTGGAADTIRALFALREDENRMREAYYLAGLMDCMINRVNPVLRTDLLHHMYKKVFSMKTALDIHWHGPLEQVLLPVDAAFFNEAEYRTLLMKAGTLKELYRAIRRQTDRMFDILSLEYVFYRPGTGG